MTFEQQADGAAAKLRASMGLPEAPKVEVDAHGNPAPPPPPPGSYASQIREQRKEAEQTAAVNEALTQVSNDADPVGSVPAEEERFTPSENVQRRIQELVGRAKEAEQLVEQFRSRATASEEELARIRQETELHLDEQTGEPDAIRQALARQRREIEAQIKPLAMRQRQDELERLARRYPGFNPALHPGLIQEFQDRNPASTIEQAFRAVAQDDELNLGTVRPAVVPPTVVPRGTSQPRSIPDPEPDPEEQRKEQIQALMTEARGLAHLRDPASVRRHQQLLSQVIRMKTGI